MDPSLPTSSSKGSVNLLSSSSSNKEEEDGLTQETRPTERPSLPPRLQRRSTRHPPPTTNPSQTECPLTPTTVLLSNNPILPKLPIAHTPPSPNNPTTNPSWAHHRLTLSSSRTPPPPHPTATPSLSSLRCSHQLRRPLLVLRRNGNIEHRQVQEERLEVPWSRTLPSLRQLNSRDPTRWRWEDTISML